MSENSTDQIRIPLKVLASTLIILGILVIGAGIATYVIPAGQYTDEVRDGLTVKVYQQVDPAPVPIWKIALAPILSLTGKNGPKIIVLLLFIVFIGGSFSVMLKAGIIPEILNRLTRMFAGRQITLLVVTSVIFALLGSCLGILEELLPLVVIMVPFALRMGWDSVTGFASVMLPLGFGFASAMFNPFTLGTAQRLADLPLFSGLSLRVPLFLITVVVATLYLVRYVRKIEKDPLSSPTHAIDEKIRPFLAPENSVENIQNLTAVIIYILICFVVLAAVVAGGPVVPLLQELAFPLIMLIFLFMGIGSGLIAGAGVKRVFQYFFRGMGDFVGAIPIILMAFSVGYLIDIGRVMDTILFYLAQKMVGMGPHGGAVALYFAQMMINFFIPSGSGQAALTIPILAPLGDLIGISRQTVVLAFQMGDGFSNMIWPTNALLLIGLGLARITYKDWFKWILPVQLVLMVVCIVFLLIAVSIGYT
jgi:uncharacterized ion transporter superfamily protein YfcC